ncbi:hypothetical protein ACIQKB_35795 [Streptomyces sp. NPDC092046]|uniref:hypothetical protein n=1 Tax=Streptomyces sp. NPDC092046 TaxID=3366009 RepID=UPI0037FE1581
MTDYRAKAVEVLSETSSNDTRGIISAILHLADTLDGRTGVAAGTGPAAGPSPAWEHATLKYLADRGEHLRPETITRWLTNGGFQVDEKTVTARLWDWASAGTLTANTRHSLTFHTA